MQMVFDRLATRRCLKLMADIARSNFDRNVHFFVSVLKFDSGNHRWCHFLELIFDSENHRCCHFPELVMKVDHTVVVQTEL